MERRLSEHRFKSNPGFTAKYNVTNLVYFEKHSEIAIAIEREKEIKAWRRKKKIKLIESMNRDWRDLAAEN